MNRSSNRLDLLMAGWWLACAMLSILLPVLTSPTADSELPDSSMPDLAMVIAQYRTDGAAAALPGFERLLADFRKAGDTAAEAEAALYIGESHWRLGQFEDSRRYLEAALVLSRETDVRAIEGRILNVLGLLEWDSGNYQAALLDFGLAFTIADELKDRRLSASILNNRGLVKDELGDYDGSTQDYQASLSLFEQVNDRRGQGDALGNIGGVHLLLGRYELALERQQLALLISEELQSKPAMTIDHGNIALSMMGLGRTEEALDHFDLALALARETGMKQEEAYWLRGKGSALVSQGHYDLGLELHRSAVDLYQQSGARGLLLDAQHDMGQLMLTLGDPVSALTWFQDAAQLAAEIGQDRSLTENLLALGNLEFRREQLEEARALYLQGLNRANESGELQLQASALLHLALVDEAQGNHSDAAAKSAEALETAQAIGAVPIISEAWFALGEAFRGKLQYSESITAFDQALAGAGDDPDLLWRIHYGKAQCLQLMGEIEAAVRSLEASVAVIESVRERLREERFRAGWVEDKYEVYIDLVQLQLSLGLTGEAFSTAERLRARSFLAQLDRRPAATPTSEEGRREMVLRERIRQLQRVLDAEQQKAPPFHRQLAIDTFSTELKQAEREYQSFLDDQGQLSKGNRKIAIPVLERLKANLAERDAVIEYVVGKQELVIFILRSDSLVAVTSSMGRDQLRAGINLLRGLVQQADSDWQQPATALSASLITPLRARGLLDGVTHLIVVPHEILNYLPFAVLPLNENNERLLVEEYTLSYLPTAALLVHSSKENAAARSLLALAPEISRLRHAPYEASSVVDMFQPNAHLLLGKQATETAFKSRAGDYQLLHFATHSVFNKQNPLLSGLELENDADNDGLLEVHEILDLELDAELVTLSACETGLASGWFNDIPAGDDFVGLTRAFLVAGGKNVLASLWEVDDHSTVDLMQGFYKRLEQDEPDTGPAEALAWAQRRLRQSKKFNHPFYWAPFVLVGPHVSALTRG